jgi:hypothetical protein
MIFHVPRLLFDQCFTTLFISVKQSWLIIGSKKRLQKPLFSGSCSMRSGTGIRLFFVCSGVVNPHLSVQLLAEDPLLYPG